MLCNTPVEMCECLHALSGFHDRQVSAASVKVYLYVAVCEQNVVKYTYFIAYTIIILIFCSLLLCIIDDTANELLQLSIYFLLSTEKVLFFSSEMKKSVSPRNFDYHHDAHP